MQRTLPTDFSKVVKYEKSVHVLKSAKSTILKFIILLSICNRVKLSSQVSYLIAT